MKNNDVYVIALGVFIGLIISGAFFVVVIQANTRSFQEDSIKAGVGEFYLDADHHPKFRFTHPL